MKQKEIIILVIVAVLIVLGLLYFASQKTTYKPTGYTSPTTAPVKNTTELDSVSKELDTADLDTIDKELDSLNLDASNL